MMEDEQTLKWASEGHLAEPRARSEASAVQSVRFGREELRLVREAAARAGLTTSEFIRRASLERAVPSKPAPALTMTSGSPGATVRRDTEGTSNASPASRTLGAA